MTSTFFTVVNPAAGGGRAKKKSDVALGELRSAGLSLEVAYTEREGHASELVREAYQRGQRRFLAVGGDGTTFEVLNGIFPRPDGDEDPVVLGMLPLGTGNSFLRDFGIEGTEDAIRALKNGRENPVDVVRADHEGGTLHYINLLSLGFTAEAGALTNRAFKPLGTAGYVLAVLACTARLKSPVLPIRLDNGDCDNRPCTLLSFSNSRFTGGSMMMAPAANVNDGKLDVIRVHGIGRLQLVRAFPKIFQGTHVDRPEAEQTQAAVVDLDVPEQDIMVDGEVLRLKVNRLEVLPQAIQVFA